MYLDVFNLNAFKWNLSVFVFKFYLNVFRCIQMYLNVFKCIRICLNVFKYIQMNLNVLKLNYMYLNGFKLFIFEIKSDIHFKNEIIKVNNMFVPVGPSKKIV